MSDDKDENSRVILKVKVDTKDEEGRKVCFEDKIEGNPYLNFYEIKNFLEEWDAISYDYEGQADISNVKYMTTICLNGKKMDRIVGEGSQELDEKIEMICDSCVDEINNLFEVISSGYLIHESVQNHETEERVRASFRKHKPMVHKICQTAASIEALMKGIT